MPHGARCGCLWRRGRFYPPGTDQGSADSEAALRQRFQRAKSERDLPANVNPADLARYVATILIGIAVQGAGGASRDKLQHVVEMTLRIWPL
jgi:hypothetical protein